MNRKESLHYYLSCIASTNSSFIIISAVFRFGLWMQSLMLYLNVKGITVLVKMLTTQGDLLRLFLSPAINTSGGWQEAHSSPGLLRHVWWK